MKNPSRVAHIRQHIERECEAMSLALYGLAVVADHDTINHKYEALGNYQEQLAQIVGDEQATEIVCEAYNQIIGEEDEYRIRFWVAEITNGQSSPYRAFFWEGYQHQAFLRTHIFQQNNPGYSICSLQGCAPGETTKEYTDRYHTWEAHLS